MDEEWTRRIIDLTGDTPRAPEVMTPRGFTREVSLLTLIVDSLQTVRNAVLAQGGGDPPTFEPMPRPTTALHQLYERAAYEALLEVDREIRGG